ncbi:MAG: tryptophan synthase subunit alpha [Pirellulales bacterium]
MSAIDQLFARLKSQNQRALMPFVTAGDPDLATTAAVVEEIVRRGAHICEIGIPYSDPIADGPVIQASYTRALEKKVKLAEILKTVHGLAGKVAAPLVTMVSYAIIYRHGLEKYLDNAQAAGVAGAIVPDLPVEEAATFAPLCRKRDFSLIQLVTPTTPRERALRIAESSSGFLYYVSVTGITGERRELPPELRENVSWLRERTPLPICIGFGISEPEHVKALAPAADGLIVGSALVRRIHAGAQKTRAELLQDVGAYIDSLLAALK